MKEYVCCLKVKTHNIVFSTFKLPTSTNNML